jgi:hypothetical protein
VEKMSNVLKSKIFKPEAAFFTDFTNTSEREKTAHIAIVRTQDGLGRTQVS